MKRNQDSYAILNPSNLSHTIGMFAGMLLALYGWYLLVFVGSESEFYTRLFLQQSAHGPMFERIAEVSRYLDQSEFVANTTVFATWALLGLLLYVAVTLIYQMFRTGNSALKAVKLSTIEGRAFVVESIAVRAVLRLLGIVGLYAIVLLTRVLTPVYIVWISDLKLSANIPFMFLLTVSLFLIGYALVHLCVVSLRLLLLRPRVFNMFE